MPAPTLSPKRAHAFAEDSIASSVGSADYVMAKLILLISRSRNAGVVVAVAVLFHYLAPHKEVAKAGKSLVRSPAATTIATRRDLRARNASSEPVRRVDEAPVPGAVSESR